MIDALLYRVHVRQITGLRAEITLVPTWFGKLLKRRTRQGLVYRALGGTSDGERGWWWWWSATGRHVGAYLERYIEAAPLLSIEDMTVEQLLLDVSAEKPRKQRRSRKTP